MIKSYGYDWIVVLSTFHYYLVRNRLLLYLKFLLIHHGMIKIILTTIQCLNGLIKINQDFIEQSQTWN